MNYHCVYKTSHPTGLFYIGKSQTDIISKKSYKGSGVKLTRYWKNEKYKKTSWNVEVLYVYETAEDAFNKEKEIIAEMKNNVNCLNLADGGVGGGGMVGKNHSEKTKNAMSISAKLAAINNPCLCKKRADNLTNTWHNQAEYEKRIKSMNTKQAKENRSNATSLRFANERKQKIEEWKEDIVLILSSAKNKSEVIINHKKIYGLK